MKAIELTEEQKEKLLEMCKSLFPEYEGIWFHSLHSTSLTGYLKTNKTQYCDFEIHWFEFCMTHLINSLAWKCIKTDILADCEYEDARLKYLSELAEDRVTGQYHPIDYLYEEFKKLK